MITYRLAREEDVPAILAIYAPYIRETTFTFEYDVPDAAAFLRRFREITARYPWLVCEEDGALLGYAYGSAAFERAAYGWDADLAVYLAGDARGRGLGTGLYRRLTALLAACGYRTLYALVTGENQASLAFHRACGFQPVAEFPNTGFKHGRWHSVIWLQKTFGSFEADPAPALPFSALPPDFVARTLAEPI